MSHRRKDARAPADAIYSQLKQRHDIYKKPLYQRPYVESEKDIIKRHYQFIKSDERDEISQDEGDDKAKKRRIEWEKRIVEKYDEKLYKEFALCKFGNNGQVAMRWRTEREVLKGKGETICANLDCSSASGLKNYETIFSYVDKNSGNEKKQALVKLSLCKECTQTITRIYSKTPRNHEESSDEQEEYNEKDEELEPKDVSADTIEKQGVKEDNAWKPLNSSDLSKETILKEYDDFFSANLP